jgi:predicted outer membrane protein
MHLRRWLVVAMVAAPCAQAQDAAPARPPEPAQGTAAVAPRDGAAEAPAPKRRLKFKGDRPTCTCVSALGESDIEAAESKSDKALHTRRSEK